MKSRNEPNQHTVSAALTVTLNNGETVTGTLWLHPSRMGSFEVEYKGNRKSDDRTNYTDERHIRMIAKQLLREMAEK